MSGPVIALVAVGVLALVASVGVGVLTVAVRRLRVELAAIRAAKQVAARKPPRSSPVRDPQVPPSHALATRDPDAAVAVPASGQVVTTTALAPTLVRMVALSHGVRRALTPENRDRIAALVRRDIRRRDKLRRRASRRAARVLPLGSSDLPAASAVEGPGDRSGADRRDLAS